MDDLIYKQAAIDAINQICPIDTEYDCTLLDRVDVRCVLTDLPPAQPEPIKINIEDFNKEDWERLKKEWGNTPITVLPSAQPDRKNGTWVPVTNGRGGHECDQCHNYAPSYSTGEERLSDYCPNCGADMRGGEECTKKI